MECILVVNAGSSSLKFQVYSIDADAKPKGLIKGQVDGIGTRPRLRATDPSAVPAKPRCISVGRTMRREATSRRR